MHDIGRCADLADLVRLLHVHVLGRRGKLAAASVVTYLTLRVRPLRARCVVLCATRGHATALPQVQGQAAQLGRLWACLGLRCRHGLALLRVGNCQGA